MQWEPINLFRHEYIGLGKQTSCLRWRVCKQGEEEVSWCVGSTGWSPQEEPSITAAWGGCLGSEQEAAGGDAFCQQKVAQVCVPDQCVGQTQDRTEASRSPLGLGRVLLARTVALLPLDASGLLLQPAAWCSSWLGVNHCQSDTSLNHLIWLTELLCFNYVMHN